MRSLLRMALLSSGDSQYSIMAFLADAMLPQTSFKCAFSEQLFQPVVAQRSFVPLWSNLALHMLSMSALSTRVALSAEYACDTGSMCSHGLTLIQDYLGMLRANCKNVVTEEKVMQSIT
jgi:hypothetical protein